MQTAHCGIDTCLRMSSTRCCCCSSLQFGRAVVSVWLSRWRLVLTSVAPPSPIRMSSASTVTSEAARPVAHAVAWRRPAAVSVVRNEKRRLPAAGRRSHRQPPACRQPAHLPRSRMRLSSQLVFPRPHPLERRERHVCRTPSVQRASRPHKHKA